MCIYVAKTKALISFAVTAKLICVFVFAYAKNRFSHNEAYFKCSFNVPLLVLVVTFESCREESCIRDFLPVGKTRAGTQRTRHSIGSTQNAVETRKVLLSRMQINYADQPMW